MGLRARAFRHIHSLSMAEHVDHHRQALVARVTSDVETLAQFTEVRGGGPDRRLRVDRLATVGVMAVYSWQLACVTVRGVPTSAARSSGRLQRRQLRAYDEVRDAVGGTSRGHRARQRRPGGPRLPPRAPHLRSASNGAITASTRRR